MTRQYFSDLPNEPLDIASGAAAFTTSIGALFTNLSQITIPASDVRPGKVWRLTAGGTITTVASGTQIITPFWGTTTGGVNLGATPTAGTPNPSVTAPWSLFMVCTCRSVGLSGANSTFWASGSYWGCGVIASFGTAAASGDPTLGGLQIGMTFTTTGVSMTPQIVVLESLN